MLDVEASSDLAFQAGSSPETKGSPRLGPVGRRSAELQRQALGESGPLCLSPASASLSVSLARKLSLPKPLKHHSRLQKS